VTIAAPLPIASLLEQLPAAVALVDGSGSVLHANRHLAALLQQDIDALRRTEWDALVHARDAVRDRELIAEFTAGVRDTYQGERRMRRPDGSDFWASVSMARFDAAAMEPAPILVRVEDVSELRQLRFDLGERRKELGALHALARRLIDVPNVKSVSWLQEIVDLVPPAFQWPQHTEAAIQVGAMRAATARHAQFDRPDVPRIRIEWHCLNGHTCFLEARYTGPDHGTAPFLEEEYPLVESLADLVKVALVASTHAEAREKAQHALQFSEAHLEVALDAVRMGVVDWDFVQEQAHMSDAAREMLALPGDRSVFAPVEVRDRIHPEDREEVRRYFYTERQSGQCVPHEFRVLRADGSVRWVVSRGRLFHDTDGRVVRRLTVLVDISERKSLEEQNRQAQKMEALGRLAGGIAHDFNNLLTVVGTTVECMRDTVGNDHPFSPDLTEIRAVVHRGTALTRQLLTFSRREVVRRVSVDLGETLRSADAMLRRLGGAGITMSITTESRPLVVRADPNQLEQVMLNLIANARDALADGGRIDVDVRSCVLDDASIELRPGLAAGRFVMLSVSDNGIGMDTHTRSRIFEPFFTTKDAAKGTGLGLSTVFGIVKQADGHIAVYSEPGQGTTFRIYLPADEAGEHETFRPTPAHGAMPRGNETILVVDDEPMMRVVVRRVLTDLGYQVLEAGDGPQAISLASDASVAIDLLLCDVSMPGYNGREVVEAMALTRPLLPTVFMSGYAADAVGDRLHLDPSIPFVEKPFTRESLAVAVRAAIDAAARRAT
jgi:PAS domain S-box-containing protein